MDEIQKLLDQAREKALAGDLDGAKALRLQAGALREIKEEETKATAIKAAVKAEVEGKRLLSAENGSESQSGASIAHGAIKAAYIKKYGEPESAVTQAMKEIYGASRAPDYYTLRAMKYADMERYCRFGIADPQLSRMILYTPDQVTKAVMAGIGIEGEFSLKATMVEAQDQLGKRQLAA